MKFKEKICEVKKEELRKKYLVWRQKSKGKMKNDQDTSKWDKWKMQILRD